MARPAFTQVDAAKATLAQNGLEEAAQLVDAGQREDRAALLRRFGFAR
jgi:hypothetical protein